MRNGREKAPEPAEVLKALSLSKGKRSKER